MDMLDIDGNYGEGGGQILRSSLALSAILNRPIRINRIRAGRKNPGLAPQHLTSVNAVATITNAEVIGGALGSETVTFYPENIRGGNYTFDVADIRPECRGIILGFPVNSVTPFVCQNSFDRYFARWNTCSLESYRSLSAKDFHTDGSKIWF